MCRHCNQSKIFYNRCRLLCHIRSHSFKTATISVQDLKVEPVPLGLYKQPPLPQAAKTSQPPIEHPKKSLTICIECKKLLPNIGAAYKDRAAHLMQYTNETYSCPVCLFTLPTMCAIRTHMRFHLKYPPYYCPECGINITNKSVHYPFTHDCEGFRMMRATARLKCPVDQCQLLHPNEFKDHMKDAHIKKVFKCPICVVACFNEPTMQNHLNTHTMDGGNNSNLKALIFYQCELCPGRLVLQNHIDNHLRTHLNTNVFPCWSCGMVFKEVFALIDHHVKKHQNQMSDAVKAMFTSTIHESENQFGKPKRIYRVVKRCDQCKRNFTYKCKYNEIPILPNECPYKCTSKLKSSVVSDGTGNQITCHICSAKMPYDWKEIKTHYALAHKNHRCLDPKLVLDRMDVEKYTKRRQTKITKRTRKRRRQRKRLSLNDQNTAKEPDSTSANQCGMCGNICENKEMLEIHLKNHKDPCMAYQCLECGQSFVVKPSFSKHLMLAHGIDNAEEYISSKECYNENALDKHQKSDIPMTPPKENQCTICMDQFQNAEELEKHFRTHGMAFLLKNTSNNKEHTSPNNISDKNKETISSPT